MKKYKRIQPEVIVGLGNNTEFLEKEPPFKTVTKLHIELEDWLGDDIMACFPCYIATENLKKGLESSKFTGFEFDEMEVTKAEYFSDNYQLKKTIPKFYWMKITGKENKNDLFLSNDDLLSYLECNVDALEYIQKNYSTNFLDIDVKLDPDKEAFLRELLGEN